MTNKGKKQVSLKKGFETKMYFHNPFTTFMFCLFCITIDRKQNFYAMTILNFEIMRYLTLIEY